MSDITVRVLTDDDWQLYRTFRLKSLAESPEAFAASLADEESFPESVWHERMQRATRLLAQRDGEDVGVASVRALQRGDQERPTAEFFGMWVDPSRRGGGIGVHLMRAACAIARSMGGQNLAYWVSTDNGPAVAFASSYGFRTTDDRRPMEARSAEAAEDTAGEGEEEMMMILPLDNDPTQAASLDA